MHQPPYEAGYDQQWLTTGLTPSAGDGEACTLLHLPLSISTPAQEASSLTPAQEASSLMPAREASSLGRLVILNGLPVQRGVKINRILLMAACETRVLCPPGDRWTVQVLPPAPETLVWTEVATC